jgi:polysaccharide export outer membrane protein
LVSFKVTFLGEVGSQGPVYIYQEKIDFLEAISRAGGVTNYANMKRVKVLRPSEAGYFEYYVDLTDVNTLSTQQMFLYPNDIVIVDPVNSKNFRNKAQDYFVLISLFTSTISTVFLIISLTK